MDGRIAALMESIKREAVLAAWPVGSIYTSTEATSPATLFGGTWERIKDFIHRRKRSAQQHAAVAGRLPLVARGIGYAVRKGAAA